MFESIKLSTQPLSPEEIKKVEKYKSKNNQLHPKAVFVKKLVKKTEWEKEYKWEGSYCKLGENSDGKVIVGFIAVNEVPMDCERMTDEELRIYDTWARNEHYNPCPLYKIH